MSYFHAALFFFINIDRETVLNWFGLKDTPNMGTFQVVIIELWNKFESGLTLGDIENILFLILFFRFIILGLRYNLKTSFYITSIGLFAGYLWYHHLIDLISMYRSLLLNTPFLNKLGMSTIKSNTLKGQEITNDFKLGENVHWYNPGQLLYYAFTKGIVNIDHENNTRFYIDPVSMIVANLDEQKQSTIIPIYYQIFNHIIPNFSYACSKFWSQMSSIAAYALITRIGKRYCPYLVRWHWTLLLMVGMVEQVIIYLIFRIAYFQAVVLIPKMETLETGDFDQLNLSLQIGLLDNLTHIFILVHVGIVLFALFHAIWGQYFYLPFFVTNTELHIGPRPKNSVYSGGYTSWQDTRERRKNGQFLKFWYGWFGKGTDKKWNILRAFRRFFKKL